MTREEKLARLEEIRIELFEIANSFAIEKEGDIAVTLHKASNQTTKATLMIEGDEEKLERFEYQEVMSGHEEMIYNLLKNKNPEMFKDED